MSRMVRRYDHYDAAALATPQLRPDGFLKVEGRISRTGIQVYYDGSGRAHREYRPPEEVFNDDALESFRLVPLTNRHPPRLLAAADARQYAIGAVGENVRKLDEKWVAAPMLIHDAETIKDIQAGRSQLSCGYTCELDETPGEVNGEKYDSIQRKIRGNHVAIVDAARAGNEARLRLDELDEGAAAMLVSDSIEPEKTPMAPHILQIGTFRYEVADGNAQAVLDRHVADAVSTAVANAEKKAAQDKADAVDKSKGELTTKLSELQAKHDALEGKEKARLDATMKCDECSGSGKIDGAKCDGCGGTGRVSAKDDSEEKRDARLERTVRRRAKARASLEVEARKHLGTDAKLDEMAELDVKKAVLVKLAPHLKLDGKDETYLRASYDIAIGDSKLLGVSDAARAGAAGQGEPKPAEKTMETPALDGIKHEDGAKAREAMLARQKKAIDDYVTGGRSKASA
jgi:hypothetical protein